ncbi:hypothetical protein N9937_01770 [bacterium]|nr:hypothetical protein [bacterium]
MPSKIPFILQADTGEFEASMAEIQAITKRTTEKLLVGVALDICFMSPQFTKKATPGAIRAFHPRPASWKNVPYGKSKAAGPRLFYATKSMKGRSKRRSRKKGESLTSNIEALRTWERRDRSRAFHSAMWLACVPIIARRVIAAPISRDAKKQAIFVVGKTKGRSNLKHHVEHSELQEAAKELIDVDIRLTGPKKHITFTIRIDAAVKPFMEKARNKGQGRALSDNLGKARDKYRAAALRYSA